MRALLLLLLLLSAPPCFAQFPYSGVSWQAPASSTAGPTSVSGIRYWWVSSDLTLNTAVTNWIDRIVGSIYTNGAASLQPTNATTGVGFKGTTYLTNTAPFSFTSPASGNTGPWTLFLILRPHTPSGSFGGIFASPAAAQGLYLNSSRQFAVFGGNGNVNPLSTVSLQNDKVIDLAISGASNIANDTFYTNAVSITSAAAFDSQMFGANMGRDPSSEFFTGSIIEAVFYTNVVSAANILVLHQYATNTYSSLTWQ